MIEVTCALICKDARLLVAQNHATSEHPLQWEFPGGKIKANETPVECILREIEEELDLKITVLEKMQAVEYDYGHKAIRLIPFLCRIESGAIKLNDHAAVKWLQAGELKTTDLAAADRILIENEKNQKVLKKYIGK